jgi:hypothetical protein
MLDSIVLLVHEAPYPRLRLSLSYLLPSYLIIRSKFYLYILPSSYSQRDSPLAVPENPPPRSLISGPRSSMRRNLQPLIPQAPQRPWAGMKGRQITAADLIAQAAANGYKRGPHKKQDEGGIIVQPCQEMKMRLSGQDSVRHGGSPGHLSNFVIPCPSSRVQRNLVGYDSTNTGPALSEGLSSIKGRLKCEYNCSV